MSATDLPLDREAMRLLAEIGFVGTLSGPVGATKTLFEALQQLRPDSNLPLIGLALNDLAAKRPDDAVRTLREVALKRSPEDAEVQAFLGLALQKAGQSAEARRVLMTVLQNRTADAEPHVRMAMKLLQSDGIQTPVPQRRETPWSEQLRATR
ncbi:MAG: tetratricopeptide repeat protein [Comamonadaceae bacterium]|nr:MAG: tetratricopeptide repeat protein [Comamonadaceae bacterium]